MNWTIGWTAFSFLVFRRFFADGDELKEVNSVNQKTFVDKLATGRNRSVNGR